MSSNIVLFSPIENPLASSVIAFSSVLTIEDSTKGIKTGINALALTRIFPSVSTPLAFVSSLLHWTVLSFQVSFVMTIIG